MPKSAREILQDAIINRKVGEYLHQKVAMYNGDPKAVKQALDAIDLVKKIHVGASDIEISRRVLRYVARD
jgi:hypothetical protein